MRYMQMNKFQFALMIIPITICYACGAFIQLCYNAFNGGMDDFDENKWG